MTGFPGVTEATLLIALGIGYIVLYFAKREEKELRFLGYTLGIVIIALAIVYILGNLWVQAKMCSTRVHFYKGMMQPRTWRPDTMQPYTPQTPPK